MTAVVAKKAPILSAIPSKEGLAEFSIADHFHRLAIRVLDHTEVIEQTLA